MFDKYKGIIDIDKVLNDVYGYTFDGIEENFYKQRFVEFEGNGKDALCWIEVWGERFIFKPLVDFEYNVWGELLSEEFAKSLGIACAEYRVGMLHGRKGIISKSFLKNNDTLVLGSEIFQDFFNRKFYQTDKKKGLLNNSKIVEMYDIPSYFEDMDVYNQKRYTFNYLNNLEQVWNILLDDDDISDLDVGRVVEFFSRMLLFDIITLQSDRHPNNWGIIKNGNRARPSPLFDNSASFGLGYFDMEGRVTSFRQEFANAKILKDEERIYSFIYKSWLNFTLSQDNVIDVKRRIKDKGPKVFDDFIRKSDRDMRLKIMNILGNMGRNDFDEMISEIEEKNGIKMDDDVYFYVTTIWEMNINYLKKIVNNYERKFSDERSKRSK